LTSVENAKLGTLSTLSIGIGGTVAFLIQAFGGGIVTGAANILLVLSYVVLVAVYAYAFGSYGAGFLLLFMAVNIANVRLARETGSLAWISGLAALSTFVALVILCIQVAENSATRNHLWILLGMIVASFAIEVVYRGITGRNIHLIRKDVSRG